MVLGPLVTYLIYDMHLLRYSVHMRPISDLIVYYNN